MQNILDLLTLDVQKEHDLEHDPEHKVLFSEPKIYDADGDLSKRWYVYFSFQDPKTGRLKRMKNIYGKTNRYKTKESRYFLLGLYRKRLLRLLQEGYSPFQDNKSLHVKRTNKVEQEREECDSLSVLKSKVDLVEAGEKEELDVNEGNITVRGALDHALELKVNVVGVRTLVDYKSRCNLFVKWITENHNEIQSIKEVDKKVMSSFLNYVQLKTSPRNRNNFRTCLGSLFQVLEDNEIVAKNLLKSIKTLKTNPERNKTYSEKQHQDIFKYLETEDPLLLLFIKFVSYNFLRPLEVCRLRVKDVNLDSNTLQFRAKNKTLKTKLIPKILVDELPDLSKMDGELLLFTPTKIGGMWETALGNRRGYFTNRFKKVVKQHYGLDSDYGLYSFRHTFITKLYRSLINDSSPHAAKSSLMQITGHSTMSALEKYLRDIDAELPKDYSIHLNS
ncbi:tyrosine-type recombinase/integrase [Mariniflexile sp. AS56]|uniref:tyrosine-type recombinase/integrase n=1 Tax=Mariniflexile sp. AS56 TaxID=3063957 RepID=UPI0026F02AA1|nr:tyrosine-type recombinase/integrase [Mariniflexile sp. AS56]MDO7173905.1 tyrosine-type recombinase/integrase [Mariniflexile sp. AS56]